MYKLVKEILDVSKEKDVDITFARDMVIADGRDSDEAKKAYNLIHEYYDVITFFRRENDETGIEKICSLYTEGKEDELKAFVKEVKRANKL